MWQSIETAPKDGTRILCVERGGFMRVDRWRNGAFWEEWNIPERRYTHWQPLPAPPQDR